MVKKLRHIGIMGEDFDRIVKKFEGFGLPCTEVLEVKPIGEVMLELITHTEPDRKEVPRDESCPGPPRKHQPPLLRSR